MRVRDQLLHFRSRIWESSRGWPGATRGDLEGVADFWLRISSCRSWVRVVHMLLSLTPPLALLHRCSRTTGLALRSHSSVSIPANACSLDPAMWPLWDLGVTLRRPPSGHTWIAGSWWVPSTAPWNASGLRWVYAVSGQGLEDSPRASARLLAHPGKGGQEVQPPGGAARSVL